MKYIFLKNKTRTLSLIFLLLLIVLFGPSVRQRCADGMCSLQRMEHKTEYSNKGSRSEAQHGYLYYIGKAIPDVFTHIRVSGTDYRFYTRKYTWGRDGYFPSEEPVKKPFEASKEKISSSQMETGWYEGGLILEDTPGDWFYVEWDGGSAFVSPNAIDKMAGSLRLKTIHREAEMPAFIEKEKD